MSEAPLKSWLSIFRNIILSVLFQKKHDREMLIRSQPITLLQIFIKIILYSLVISMSITDTDSTCNNNFGIENDFAKYSKEVC